MRQLLSLALVVGLVSFVSGQDKPGASLKVGDAAPALKATKWLQGTEVKEFAPGQVYVVEFWATWCGPCIVMMPHLSDLQAEYKNKGVTFIGYTARDQSNTQERVEAFVKKRGPNLKYTMAYADDRETYSAWMKAAGRTGIPCCFVVDKGSKIAYVGHPMYLDVVLPKVVGGTWKNDDDNALMEKIEKEVSGVFKALSGTDPEDGLKTVAAFEKDHPELAGIPYFTGSKLNAMLKLKRYEEASKFAENVLAKALKSQDPLPPMTVASIMSGALAKDNKDLLGLSLKAAETGLKIAGDDDARALLAVAESHFVLGDKARAKDFGMKAVTAAEKESAAMKAFITMRAKKYTEEPKDNDK